MIAKKYLSPWIAGACTGCIRSNTTAIWHRVSPDGLHYLQVSRDLGNRHSILSSWSIITFEEAQNIWNSRLNSKCENTYEILRGVDAILNELVIKGELTLLSLNDFQKLSMLA
jgi:hypothetical protein